MGNTKVQELERLMSEQVAGMTRSFDLYKDKVDELDSICDAYAVLIKKEQNRSHTYRELLLRIKFISNDDSAGGLAHISSLFDGLTL